jgi:hypothetical protein
MSKLFVTVTLPTKVPDKTREEIRKRVSKQVPEATVLVVDGGARVDITTTY